MVNEFPTNLKFAAIGECMLELSHRSSYELNLGFAGDTYNVATYLARFSRSLALQVSYVTAVGDDPYSDMMIATWQKENIDTSKVIRLAKRLPGLYLIRTEPASGERHFYYYRKEAPVKQLFQTAKAQQIISSLANYDFLYVSGITLAILEPESLTHLFALLTTARQQGCKVIFDGNYRATLWQNQAAAKEITKTMLALTDIALPTLCDEMALFADIDANACAKRLHAGLKHQRTTISPGTI